MYITCGHYAHATSLNTSVRCSSINFIVKPLQSLPTWPIILNITCAHGWYLVSLSLPQSLLLHQHSRLRWKRVADLPVAMSQHNIVRIGNTIYCGGGYTYNIDTGRQVFQYNPKQDTWSQLPICPTLQFGLTQLDGKLVTVGGSRIHQPIPISDIYIFHESETRENSSIPLLPTARTYPTAFKYKSALIVSGRLT